MHSKYFEEFEVGERHKSRCCSLSEGQIMDFAMTYDPQHMHMDHDRANAGPFGGIIASGFQTMCLAFRLFYELGLTVETNIIGLGYDKIRWLKPLYPGKSFYVEVELLEKIESKSKPDRGILTWRFETFLNDGEMIMTNEATMMVKRKPS